MYPAWYQIVSRALRCALHQDRRFNFEEIAFVKVVTDELDHPVAQGKVALHLGSSQVKVTILEPQRLVGFGAARDLKRHRLGAIQYLYAVGCNLDVACIQIGIYSVSPALLHG